MSTESSTSIVEPKLSEDVIRGILPIISKTPWLINNNFRTAAVAEIFEQSKNHPLRWDLMMHLICEFTYVNETAFLNAKNSIASKILEWKNDNFITLVCATSDDDEADGSQALLQSLKNAEPFIEHFNKGQFLNSITAPVSLLSGKKIRKKRMIILVDDFIGTGDTIERKLNWLIPALDKLKIREMVEIRVCALAYMKQSLAVINALQEKNYLADFFAPIELKRGISDHFTGEDKDNKLSLMKAIENELALRYKHLYLTQHSMGFKKSESLFSWADNNIPNNVFPVFWWPKLKTGKQRKTIFRRIS